MGFSAATIASIPLAMGVTVFDRSVIQFANGSAPSLGSAVYKGFRNIIQRPFTTFNSLDNRAVMAVYVPTYITKNGGCKLRLQGHKFILPSIHHLNNSEHHIGNFQR